jgi:hypothetical protein
MKTSKQIVAAIKEWSCSADEIDDALHDRAKALKGQPAEKLEWHLGWLFNSVDSLTRRLREAVASDKREASDVLSHVNAGDRLEPRRSDLSRVYHNRTGEYIARLEEAHEALRRFLDVYEALAVDPPGAK